MADEQRITVHVPMLLQVVIFIAAVAFAAKVANEIWLMRTAMQQQSELRDELGFGREP